MDRGDCWASGETRKRQSLDEEEDGVLSFSFDELNQDLLEKVLSWLPASSFYRLGSVCKRWKSVTASTTFLLACSQIPSREPWFFMVDPQLTHPIIFDSAERNWKQLNYPPLLQQENYCSTSIIPVAASGGLICFRSASGGEFIICNPLTGSCRQLPSTLDYPAAPRKHQSLHAIGMKSPAKSYHNSYKLVLVSGGPPKISIEVYNSSTDRWEEEIMLNRKVDNSLGPESNDEDDDDSVYFLSKAGNVVATNMQRSPSKQYSSVLITAKDGHEEEEEMIYFLSSSGTIVGCSLTRKCFYEYPRLLPVFSEYSIDVVECRGEMLVVVLSEFLESASLRVWKFDDGLRTWHQIAAMPPAMSHELYGKKVDINCTGAGHQILVCLNATEFFGYVLCDLMANEWVELPACYVNGKAKEFMSAFSIEPRIEASV